MIRAGHSRATEPRAANQPDSCMFEGGTDVRPSYLDLLEPVKLFTLGLIKFGADVGDCVLNARNDDVLNCIHTPLSNLDHLVESDKRCLQGYATALVQIPQAKTCMAQEENGRQREGCWCETEKSTRSPITRVIARQHVLQTSFSRAFSNLQKYICSPSTHAHSSKAVKRRGRDASARTGGPPEGRQAQQGARLPWPTWSCS